MSGILYRMTRLAIAAVISTALAAGQGRVIPPPARDAAPGAAEARQEASALSAQYDIVTTGRTGHAESVQVTFDPKQISYGRLLQIFFSVAHDPTELNRQGPDVGTQYRSAIFPATADQARIAEAYVAQLRAARVFDSPIVTTIETETPFYPAEAYHQDFLARNPTNGYIVINDLPKIDALRRVLPDVFRAAPVLVKPGRRWPAIALR